MCVGGSSSSSSSASSSPTPVVATNICPQVKMLFWVRGLMSSQNRAMQMGLEARAKALFSCWGLRGFFSLHISILQASSREEGREGTQVFFFFAFC